MSSHRLPRQEFLFKSPRRTIPIGFLKLDTVFAGESIFIEYASVLEAFVSAGYTRSDGKRLLHVYKEKGLESDTYLTWFFRKQLPEFERIGEVLANIQEAGLVEHWKKKTWWVRN